MNVNNSSLGLIETYGMTTAIQAGDAMCKAADVNIVGYKKVGSGLVTVYVQGEVGAVQVAIESGVLAAERVGKVISSLIIPRPDSSVIEQLNKLGNHKEEPTIKITKRAPTIKTSSPNKPPKPAIAKSNKKTTQIKPVSTPSLEKNIVEKEAKQADNTILPTVNKLPTTIR